MKNFEKERIKYLVIFIFAVAIFGIILYPVFDLVLFKFITNSEFVYSIHKYIIQPILFAFITGTVFWVVDNDKKDKLNRGNLFYDFIAFKN